MQYLSWNDSVLHNKSLSLNVDVSFESYIFTWRHNKYAFDVTNSGISVGTNGRLIFEHVKPSDAGYYEVIIFTEFSCTSIFYHLFIECKSKGHCLLRLAVFLLISYKNNCR